MKVHKEGTGLLLTLFTILFIVNITLYHTVGKGMLFYSVAFVSTVLFLLVLNFFRSPFRRFPYDSEGLVIAPADGTIVAIEEVMENEILHKKCLQISIFMSIFNVHANWFPVNGTVKHVSHQNGRFMAAYLPKSSTENERSAGRDYHEERGGCLGSSDCRGDGTPHRYVCQAGREMSCGRANGVY